MDKKTTIFVMLIVFVVFLCNAITEYKEIAHKKDKEATIVFNADVEKAKSLLKTASIGSYPCHYAVGIVNVANIKLKKMNQTAVNVAKEELRKERLKKLKKPIRAEALPIFPLK